MPKARARRASGLFGADYRHRAKDILSQRFLLPPFSVLNAREGWWQERKRQWLSIGIKSELGRGDNLLARSLHERVSIVLGGHYRDVGPFIERLRESGSSDDEIIEAALSKAGSGRPPSLGMKLGQNAGLSEKQQRSLGLYRAGGSIIKRGARAFNPTDEKDRPLMNLGGRYAEKGNRAIPGGGTGKNSAYLFKTEDGYAAGDDAQAGGTGTSIFDPVVCELVYRWFAPPHASILDPFAGGSVRGIVAGELGHKYTGIELSRAQLEANEEQARTIGTEPVPRWLEGDSVDARKIVGKERFDLIFSCPPYGHLERYSDDPRDLSTLSTKDFADKFIEIVVASCALLKPSGFACFVVGDYRDSDGYLQNFPAVTSLAFLEAGLQLYNHAILITATGSLPLRVNQMFSIGRKLGTTHQHVMVFSKGQPKEFVRSWPPFEEPT